MRRVVLTALALALAGAPMAHATYPGGNGKLAFDEAGSISTVNHDGTGHQVLATGTDPAWSPQGSRIAFASGLAFQSRAATVMNADGSGRRNVTGRSSQAFDPTWSPDGQQIAVPWDPGIAITRLDGTESRLVPIPSLCCFEDLDWSPTGDTIAFSAQNGGPSSTPAEIFRIDADGSNLTQVTDEELPATDPEWSPDGTRILYGVAGGGAQDVVTIRPDGSDRTFVTQGRDPALSPDSGEIAYMIQPQTSQGTSILANRTDHESSYQIFASATAKDNLDWQRVAPAPPYPRPRYASPAAVSLVPTYRPCLQPNRQHGPPLVSGSCNPPVQGSAHLTVGAPGEPARFHGRLAYRVLSGDPGTPTDDADVALTASLSDIRCRTAGIPCSGGAFSDYTGQLKLGFGVRITDKLNALGHSITVQDQFLSATIPCSATSSSPAGSDCGTSTTLDAITPGVVPEGKRSNWELDQIVIYDGGPNGDMSSGPLTPFAVPGVFVP
jgi:hypothetical protein